MPLSTLTILLATIAVATLAVPLLRMPAPIVLALAGVVISFLPSVGETALDPNLVLIGFLPPLLYADAFRTSWRDFSRWLRPIVMLAVGLVAVTILAVGLVAKWMLPDLPWTACFILGAVVSPTDTVAAQSVIERLRVPRRITAIIGGESLVNDATGLVGVQLGVAAVLGGSFEFGGTALRFLSVAGLGVAIGVCVGGLFALLNARVRDSAVLFTLSLLSPYLAFALANQAGASGVLAVVVAGFVVAWRVHRVAATSRVALYAAWGLLTFLLNGLCFVYVGLETPRLLRGVADGHSGLLPAAIAVALAVIAARVVFCYPGAYLPLWLMPRTRAREGGYPSLRGVTVVAWCGVRGAVSLAAALALPITDAHGAPFPGRYEIVACTVTVILATLVLQGITLHPLVKVLRIPDDPSTELELRHARQHLMRVGIARLDAFCSDQSCPIAVHRYREAMVDYLGALQADDAAERASATKRLAVSREVREAVRQAQEAELLRLRDVGEINDLAYQELLLQVDVGAD